MSEVEMMPHDFLHRGTAAIFGLTIALAIGAGGYAMYWGGDAQRLSSASEAPMMIEDRVAALTQDLAQVKMETVKLRERQGDTSNELSDVRASLANNQRGLAALRVTTDENQSNLAQLRDQTHRLQATQDEAAVGMSSLRASVDSLRASAGEIKQRIEHLEAVGDATGSIGGSHKHHGHRRWVTQHSGAGPIPLKGVPQM